MVMNAVPYSSTTSSRKEIMKTARRCGPVAKDFTMIEPYSTSPATAAALRPATSKAAAIPTPPVAAIAPVKTGAELSPLAAAVKTLASAPPVDTARVASLRAAIVAGRYSVDPQAIAEKMLVLDRGSRG